MLKHLYFNIFNGEKQSQFVLILLYLYLYHSTVQVYILDVYRLDELFMNFQYKFSLIARRTNNTFIFVKGENQTFCLEH